MQDMGGGVWRVDCGPLRYEICTGQLFLTPRCITWLYRDPAGHVQGRTAPFTGTLKECQAAIEREIAELARLVNAIVVVR